MESKLYIYIYIYIYKRPIFLIINSQLFLLYNFSKFLYIFTFFIHPSSSDLTDKMKRSFFQAAVVSILLYGCTTWTLTKRLEKKLDGNYTIMLRATLNKSWRQHPTRHQLYGHLPPITKTIQVRRTRHAGHCWRSKDELIRDVLLWTPTYGRAKAGRPARTYIQQLCEDTGCNPEDLPEAMNDREKWRERVRDIRAGGTTWWWWWWWWCIHLRLTSLIKPHSHDDGSAEPKRYSVDWLCFPINPHFLFGLLVNFLHKLSDYYPLFIYIHNSWNNVMN